MNGPIHCIASDWTGIKVALAYGFEIAIMEQYAICELGFAHILCNELS